MDEAKHLWEVLIPKKGNDGVRFAQEHHRPCFALIRKISPGLTRFPAVHGEFEDEDQPESPPYVEPMIPVRFTATVGDAKKVAHFAREHYRQIKIMLTIIARHGEYFLVGEEEDSEPIEQQAFAATN